MNIYFASILDHLGQPVLNLEHTATAKHSAFLATQYIKECPPAQGFKINKRFIEAKTIAYLLNKGA
jgi:hypothetical protein